MAAIEAEDLMHREWAVNMLRVYGHVAKKKKLPLVQKRISRVRSA